MRSIKLNSWFETHLSIVSQTLHFIGSIFDQLIKVIYIKHHVMYYHLRTHAFKKRQNHSLTVFGAIISPGHTFLSRYYQHHPYFAPLLDSMSIITSVHESVNGTDLSIKPKNWIKSNHSWHFIIFRWLSLVETLDLSLYQQ